MKIIPLGLFDSCFAFAITLIIVTTEYHPTYWILAILLSVFTAYCNVEGWK